MNNVFLQRAISRAVQQSGSGDVLFIHYSGHGTQVRLRCRTGHPSRVASRVISFLLIFCSVFTFLNTSGRCLLLTMTQTRRKMMEWMKRFAPATWCAAARGTNLHSPCFCEGCCLQRPQPIDVLPSATFFATELAVAAGRACKQCFRRSAPAQFLEHDVLVAAEPDD